MRLDDFDIQILLALQKACNKKGIKLPFEETAIILNEINPQHNISGSAIIQHLTKLRLKRIDQALPVPSPLTRRGGTRKANKKDVVSKKPEDSEAKEEKDYSDIDDTYDPEASSDGNLRKRVKREKSNNANDEQVKNSRDIMAAPTGNAVKGNGEIAGTNKKLILGPVPAPKRNATPESPTAGAAKRARSRRSVNYAEAKDSDHDQMMTDVKAHNSRMANGSNLLDLIQSEPSEVGDDEEGRKKDATASDNAKRSLMVVLKIDRSQLLKQLTKLDNTRFVNKSYIITSLMLADRALTLTDSIRTLLWTVTSMLRVLMWFKPTIFRMLLDRPPTRTGLN